MTLSDDGALLTDEDVRLLAEIVEFASRQVRTAESIEHACRYTIAWLTEHDTIMALSPAGRAYLAALAGDPADIAP